MSSMYVASVAFAGLVPPAWNDKDEQDLSSEADQAHSKQNSTATVQEAAPEILEACRKLTKRQTRFVCCFPT